MKQIEDVTATLSADDARSLTDEVKDDAERLWRKLVELYDGGAHLALGYSSWGAYFKREFGGSERHAYRLLDSGRVLDTLSSNDQLVTPKNEAQARELAPLLDQPDELRETWAEVREIHPEPTAADVRDAVQRRRGMDVHYSSETNLWSTPQDLFDVLNAEFRFGLDVCATPENAKCRSFFTSRDDGLAQSWLGADCWMNPPYGSEIGVWVKKARETAEEGGRIVCCLLPARVDTGWWWDYCRHAEIRFLRGRLRFGGGENSAPFPSAVVIFGHPATVVWWDEWRKV